VVLGGAKTSRVSISKKGSHGSLWRKYGKVKKKAKKTRKGKGKRKRKRKRNTIGSNAP
jgi:hypothetical protein